MDILEQYGYGGNASGDDVGPSDLLDKYGFSGAAPAIPEWVGQTAAIRQADDSPYASQSEVKEVDGLDVGDVLGIPGSIAGGFTDLAKGLGGLVMSGLGDLYKGGRDVAEAITPMENTDQDYAGDDIAKALFFDPERSDRGGLAGLWEDSLGAVKDDWTRRYMEPFQEHGLGGVVESLTHDPVPAMLDVAGAASLAGKGVSAASRAAYTVSKTGGPLAGVGRGVVSELDELGKVRAAGFAKRDEAVQARAKGNLTESLQLEGEAVAIEAQASGLAARLSPMAKNIHKIHPGRGMPSWNTVHKGVIKERSMPLGGVRPTPLAAHGGSSGGDLPRYMMTPLKANPIERAARGALHKYVGSASIGRIADRIGASVEKLEQAVAQSKTVGFKQAAQDLMDSGVKGSELAGDVTRLEGDLRRIAAARQQGLSRVEHPTLTNIRTKKVFDRIAGRYTSGFYGFRDQALGEFKALVEEYEKKGVHIDESWLQVNSAGNIQFKMPFQDIVNTVGNQVGKDQFFDPSLLLPEDVSKLKTALGDKFTFDEKTLTLTVADMGEAQTVLRDSAKALGGYFDESENGFVGPDINAEMFRGAKGYIDLPGKGRIGMRVLTRQGQRVASAIDDVFRDFDLYADSVKHLETEIPRLQAEHAAALQTIKTSTGPMKEAALKVAAETKEALDNAHDTLAKDRSELNAMERTAQDHAELLVMDQRRVRDGIDQLDPSDERAIAFNRAEAAARIRVLRHNMTVGPFRQKKYGQKLYSFSQMMERAYLPVKLEFFDKLKAERQAAGLTPDGTPPTVVDAARAADETASIDQQRRLLEAGQLSQGAMGRILTDIINNPGGSRMNFLPGRLEEIADMKLWEVFDELYQNAGRQTPVYFPHIDKRMLKPKDWLMQKFPVGWKNKATDITSKRAMGHVYQNGSYLGSPLGRTAAQQADELVQAYGQRAAQVRKYMDLMDMMDELTDTFGRPVEFMDDINAYEALMAPRLVKHQFRVRHQTEEKIEGLIQEGHDEHSAFFNGIGGAVVDLERHMGKTGTIEEAAKKMLGDKFGTFENGEVMFYAVPKVIAKRMDDMSKFHLGWKARIFWDSPLNVWRSFVLALSPRWIMYNLLCNTTFLALQGVGPQAFIDAARLTGGGTAKKMANGLANTKVGRSIIEGLGGNPETLKNWTPHFLKQVEDMMKKFRDSGDPDLMDLPGRIAGGFFSDVSSQLRHFGVADQTEYARMGRYVMKNKIVKGGSKFADRMKNFNEMVESSFRTASFLRSAERQMAEQGAKKAGSAFIKSQKRLEHIAEFGLKDTDAIGRALEETNYFFNDYFTMGPTERNVVKRYIMPFWSFYKHQLKLLLTYPIEHPLKAQVLRYSGEVSKDIAQSYGLVPDWMIGSVPMGEGPRGQEKFLNTSSANPFSGFLQGPEGIAGGLAPQLRGAYEMASGRDIVTSKPFTSPDTITPIGSKTPYKVNEETGEIEPTVVRPKPWEILAQQFPQAQLIGDVISGGANYDTGGLSPLGGPRIDTPAGNAMFPQSRLQPILAYAGLSLRDFDQQGFIQRELDFEQAALVGALRRQGLLPMPPEEERTSS